MKTKLMASTVLTLLTSVPAIAASIEYHDSTFNAERSARENKDLKPSLAHSLSDQERIATDLSLLSDGRISSADLRAALHYEFLFNQNGVSKAYSILEASRFILSEKARADAKNEGGISYEEKELRMQKARAFRLLPQFLCLGAIVDTAGNSKSAVLLFNQEIANIPEMLSKLETLELKYHLDVIEAAIQQRARDPEISGDYAYFKALAETPRDRALPATSDISPEPLLSSNLRSRPVAVVKDGLSSVIPNDVKSQGNIWKIVQNRFFIGRKFNFVGRITRSFQIEELNKKGNYSEIFSTEPGFFRKLKLKLSSTYYQRRVGGVSEDDVIDGNNSAQLTEQTLSQERDRLLSFYGNRDLEIFNLETLKVEKTIALADSIALREGEFVRNAQIVASPGFSTVYILATIHGNYAQFGRVGGGTGLSAREILIQLQPETGEVKQLARIQYAARETKTLNLPKDMFSPARDFRQLDDANFDNNPELILVPGRELIIRHRAHWKVEKPFMQNEQVLDLSK